MMSLRHAMPLHTVVGRIQVLPLNHDALRFELVQSIPTPSPSASLPTLVNQTWLASGLLYGRSTSNPMNDVHGASST